MRIRGRWRGGFRIPEAWAWGSGSSKPGPDPAGCGDGAGGSCPQPGCPVSGSATHSAYVGPTGGPIPVPLQSAMSGYSPKGPPLTWENRTASLAGIAWVASPDSGGLPALSQPTTEPRLIYIGGQALYGTLGRNWTHEAELILVEHDSMTVDVRHETGRWDRYTYSGGQWNPENGRRSTLVTLTDGSWQETAPDGTVYSFPSGVRKEIT